MIRRVLATLLVAWIFGFLWFAVALPQPAGTERTEAIVVPTGSGGRIERGLSLLREQTAGHMLVTGVDISVKPREFAKQYRVSRKLMDCCITLGFNALDTRGNARETAAWVKKRHYKSLRLVTADWHVRRTALELDQALPSDTRIILDGVQTEPSLWTLFLEYNKLLTAAAVWGLNQI